MEQTSDALNFLLELTEKAATMAREAYNAAGNSFDMKDDFTPVTEHDIAINEMIIEETKKRFPEWGVVGEERTWNPSAETIVMVDPIDGTRPFTFGVPVFGFIIAVMQKQDVVAAVLNNPIVNRTIYAETGKGAYHMQSNTRLSVSKRNTLDHAVLNLGTSSVVSSHMRRHLRGKHRASITSFASASETAAMVALGHLEADFMVLKSPHDVVASKLIIEEAGGKVSDLDGNEHDFRKPINGAILSNGLLHEEIMKLKELADEDYKSDYFND